jgi:hypothetical protein
MTEQLIENWLIKATEKSFQIPFCFMLANEGYTILHLTRHCGMEHGKDVIAIDANGIPCAFQLKGTNGSKIKLSYWQKHLLGQVNQLVYHKLMHPSIPSTAQHLKSFFVTNGEMEEEVFSAIKNDNTSHELNGHPEFRLNTIVKGELIEKSKRLGLNFIPPDFNDFKILLEFYLEDGTGTLEKNKFSHLLEVIFNRSIRASESGQLIRGSALLTSLATTSFSNKENNVALVEAWIIFISYLFRFVEKNKIAKKHWINEFNIANQIITTSLENLWRECSNITNFLNGIIFEDAFVHNARTTWILGLISSLGIYYKLNDDKEEEVIEIHEFCQKHRNSLELYGEVAVPNFLSYYWFFRLNDPTEKPIEILSQLINTILSNIKKKDIIYANVYYDIDESLSLRWEKEQKIIEEKNQKGTSYFLEGLIHLFVRENYKQRMAIIWPDISKLFFSTFRYANIIDFYKWRNYEGKEVLTTPKPTKSWKELKSEAAENMGNDIPELLKKNAHLYPLFLNVYPFRVSASGLRWFDSYLKDFF